MELKKKKSYGWAFGALAVALVLVLFIPVMNRLFPDTAVKSSVQKSPTAQMTGLSKAPVANKANGTKVAKALPFSKTYWYKGNKWLATRPTIQEDWTRKVVVYGSQPAVTRTARRHNRRHGHSGRRHRGHRQSNLAYRPQRNDLGLSQYKYSGAHKPKVAKLPEPPMPPENVLPQEPPMPPEASVVSDMTIAMNLPQPAVDSKDCLPGANTEQDVRPNGAPAPAVDIIVPMHEDKAPKADDSVKGDDSKDPSKEVIVLSDGEDNSNSDAAPAQVENSNKNDKSGNDAGVIVFTDGDTDSSPPAV